MTRNLADHKTTLTQPSFIRTFLIQTLKLCKYCRLQTWNYIFIQSSNCPYETLLLEIIFKYIKIILKMDIKLRKFGCGNLVSTYLFCSSIVDKKLWKFVFSNIRENVTTPNIIWSSLVYRKLRKFWCYILIKLVMK